MLLVLVGAYYLIAQAKSLALVTGDHRWISPYSRGSARRVGDHEEFAAAASRGFFIMLDVAKEHRAALSTARCVPLEFKISGS